MFELYNFDNMKVDFDDNSFDVIFGDYVYENTDFSWINKYWKCLKSGGVFISMTDFHSVFELGMKMKSFLDGKFVNHLVWKNEFGNFPKDRFHQCFDDIVIFSKGSHKFYSDRVQVEKATANTKLNPSGRMTKTATAFISDICLTTTSNERIKTKDGHLIKWQKPLGLIQRVLDPFTDEGDRVLDLFMGSGTVGEWCVKNKRYYVGLESNEETYLLAEKRIIDVAKEM